MNPPAKRFGTCKPVILKHDFGLIKYFKFLIGYCRRKSILDFLCMSCLHFQFVIKENICGFQKIFGGIDCHAQIVHDSGCRRAVTGNHIISCRSHHKHSIFLIRSESDLSSVKMTHNSIKAAFQKKNDKIISAYSAYIFILGQFSLKGFNKKLHNFRSGLSAYLLVNH